MKIIFSTKISDKSIVNVTWKEPKADELLCRPDSSKTLIVSAPKKNGSGVRLLINALENLK